MLLPRAQAGTRFPLDIPDLAQMEFTEGYQTEGLNNVFLLPAAILVAIDTQSDFWYLK
jgi:hypothetical protein